MVTGTQEPRKYRAWFQVRLSTAVAMMCVAGVVVGLNCKAGEYVIDGRKRKGGQQFIAGDVFPTYGWPFRSAITWSGNERVASIFFADAYMEGSIVVLLVIPNLIVMLIIVALVGAIFEYVPRIRLKRM